MSLTAERSTARRPTGRGWVRGPTWDLCWLLSPLWLAPVFALLTVGWPDAWRSPAHTFYVVVAALFWIGHRFSSSWLAWMSSAYRPLLRSQRARFVWVPLAAVGAVFCVVLDPTGRLPGTPLSRAAILGAIDYLFVTWHFAAQHFGLLSLYRGRAGRASVGRGADRAFALGIGGLMVVVAELLQGRAALPQDWLPHLLQDEVLAPVSAVAVPLFAGMTLLLTGLMVAAELRAPQPSLPRALYLAGLGLTVMSAFYLDPFVFLALWTIPHWLSAMALASVVAGGEPPPPPDARWHWLFHGINRRPLRWMLVLALLSILATPLFEVEVAAGPEDLPVLWALGPTALETLTTLPVLPWLLALGLATGVLHYLLDRAVWRLSDPEVRQAAAPLLRGP